MTLRAVVENLDDIDESLHSEYIEKDGKFYLDLDDSIRVHSAVSPLQTTLERLKKDKKTLTERLNEANEKAGSMPEDFDPEKWDEIKSEYEKLVADPAYRGGAGNGADTQRMKDQYETRIRNLEAKHRTEIEQRDTQLADRDRSLNGIIVGDGLTSALVEAGVDKKFLKATKAMLQGSVKVVVDEDTGERRAVVETDLGETDVKQFVENWAKSDEGKSFVTPPVGGGASGSGAPRITDNPFSNENWNVTEQGRLVTEKGVEHATRLAKAAGTTVGGPRPASRSKS